MDIYEVEAVQSFSSEHFALGAGMKMIVDMSTVDEEVAQELQNLVESGILKFSKDTEQDMNLDKINTSENVRYVTINISNRVVDGASDFSDLYSMALNKDSANAVINVWDGRHMTNCLICSKSRESTLLVVYSIKDDSNGFKFEYANIDTTNWTFQGIDE